MLRKVAEAWSVTLTVKCLSPIVLRFTESTLLDALSEAFSVVFLLFRRLLFTALILLDAWSEAVRTMFLLFSFMPLTALILPLALSVASSFAVPLALLTDLTLSFALSALPEALSVASRVALPLDLLADSTFFSAFLALPDALSSASSFAVPLALLTESTFFFALSVFDLALESSTSSFALLLSAVFLILSMEALMLSELNPQRSAKALAACSLMPEASACRMIASRASCSTPFARSISPLLKPVLSPCLRIFSAAFWALLAMSSKACLVFVPCSENLSSRFPLWSNTTPLSLQVSDSSPIF